MSIPGVDIPVGIKDNTKKGAQSIKRTLTSTFKDIATTAAGFLARDLVKGLVDTGRESIELASKAESLQMAFDNLRIATGNYETDIDSLKEATRDAVSEVDLLAAANQFMALNLPVNQMEEMWEAAIKVGRAMGMDATKSVQDFNVALGRASPLILDNFGLVLKQAEAEEIYAEKLGKSTEALTENERKMAFREAAIIKLTERAGQLGDTTDDAISTFDQFNALLEDIKTTIGQALLPAVVSILKEMNKWLTRIEGVIEGLERLHIASSDVAAAQDQVEKAQARLNDAQAEATLRAKEYATAQEATSSAMTRRNDLIDERVDKLAAVESAVSNLDRAEGDLLVKQGDLASALSFASGELDSFAMTTEDMVWSTERAQQVFVDLSSSLSDVQGVISATTDEMNLLNESMSANSAEMSENRLAIDKIKDAIQDRADANAEEIISTKGALDAARDKANEDGKVTNAEQKVIDKLEKKIEKLREAGEATKDEREAIRELEGANRNLRISNDETSISLTDLAEALKDGETSAEDLTGKLDALTESQDAVNKATVDVATETEKVKVAEEDLAKALEDLGDAITTVIDKQIVEAGAHSDTAEAARAEERAIRDLIDAKQDLIDIEKEKVADRALRNLDEAERNREADIPEGTDRDAFPNQFEEPTPEDTTPRPAPEDTSPRPAPRPIPEVGPILTRDQREERGISGVPQLAEGGIVTRATLALIGEKGPEAVIPLSGGRGLKSLEGPSGAQGDRGVQGAQGRDGERGPEVSGGGPVTVVIEKLADSMVLSADNIPDLVDQLLDEIGVKLSLKGINMASV